MCRSLYDSILSFTFDGATLQSMILGSKSPSKRLNSRKITLEVVYGSKRTIREAVWAASAGPQDVESVLEPFGANRSHGSYGIRLEKYESNLKIKSKRLNSRKIMILGSQLVC